MKKLVYGAIVFCLLIIGSLYVYKITKVKNVFDEMYYAETQTLPELYTFTNFQNLLSGDVLEKLSSTVSENYVTDKYKIMYQDKSLEDNEYIGIYFDAWEKTITVIGTVNYAEEDVDKFEGLRFIYLYRVTSKELTMKNVTLASISDDQSERDFETDDPEKIAAFLDMHSLDKKDLTRYQEYFLYEKLLTDWFEHNSKSRYSLEDLGVVKIIE